MRICIVTGDVVDSPGAGVFGEANRFLADLEKRCKPRTGDRGPQMIVVPGNHDFQTKGFLRLPWGSTFYDHFKKSKTDYFFRPENVWVYAFDSAKDGSYSGGKIQDVELDAFHAAYQKNKETYGSDFENGFKIVSVHHHPLPVNWDTARKQRWLTMINSGTLLGALLHRKVDLVLHGHEHLQGRARLRSTLGGKDDWEITVISLGATLRKVDNPNRNWFNLISIVSKGEVEVVSFPADQNAFEDVGECYTVRSMRAAREKDFEEGVGKSGFVYREVASITDLRTTGDCRRIVECNDLEILNASTLRAQGHTVQFPPTSGSLQRPQVFVPRDSRYPGTHFEPATIEVKEQSLIATIKYGNATLNEGDKVTYRYEWWATNSFAMDMRQFQYKYGDESGLEFTHYPVEDPIKELTVVVQFPKGFQPASRPLVRVAKTDYNQPNSRKWTRVGGAERELEGQNALRYIESLRVAALRVSMPQQGYCYGIEWRVPDQAVAVLLDLEIQQLQSRVLESSKDENMRPVLAPILDETAKLVRRELLIGWEDDIQMSLMLFDEGSLLVISAANFGKRGKIAQLDKSKVQFSYGEGICGRAFKGNKWHLHVHAIVGVSSEPNYYRTRPGQTPHRVLLAVPIRNPRDRNQVYGILNISAEDYTCPLTHAGDPEGSLPESKLSTFESAINECIFKGLRSAVEELARVGLIARAQTE